MKVGCTLVTVPKSTTELAYTLAYKSGLPPNYIGSFTQKTSDLISKTGTCAVRYTLYYMVNNLYVLADNTEIGILQSD